MPISAVDTISLAFQHTKQQLARPFRVGQWVKLALLGLATGEMSSGGGCSSNFNVPSGAGRHPAASDQLAPAWPSLPHLPTPQLVAIIAAGLLLVIAIAVGLLYLNSICRFILFDSILNRQVVFRGSWKRWRPAGRRFFVWQILFQIVVMMSLVVLAGIPLGIAFAAGWLTAPKQHVLPLVLGGVLLFFVLMIAVISMMLVQVIAKDFVVPPMALENLDWDEAWKRVLAMMKAEKGGYAGYIGMKVVLAIATALLVGIVGVICMLAILLPVIAVAAAIGIAGHLIWNVFTITAAVVGGLLVVSGLLFLMSMISVPVVVFFPAYSIYFFAARYPALSARLYPVPVIPTPPSSSPTPFGAEPAV